MTRQVQRYKRAQLGAEPAPTPVEESPEGSGPIPSHWSFGALLNVRNTGADNCVTLHPEEYDPRHPERAMRFANPATCQDFVSAWYSRQSADPRAR